MMRKRLAAIALGLGLALAPGLIADTAGQETARSGDLVAEGAWARATPGLAETGAAYVTVSNRGSEPGRLVAAATPVAERAELHTHLTEDGVMKMRPVDAVEIAPGQRAVFAPGGLHIMLFGLTVPLKEGDRFPLTLTFEKGGSVTVDVVVRSLGATGPSPDGMARQGHGHQSHD